jgi:hypothetical protein
MVSACEFAGSNFSVNHSAFMLKIFIELGLQTQFYNQ